MGSRTSAEQRPPSTDWAGPADANARRRSRTDRPASHCRQPTFLTAAEGDVRGWAGCRGLGAVLASSVRGSGITVMTRGPSPISARRRSRLYTTRRFRAGSLGEGGPGNPGPPPRSIHVEGVWQSSHSVPEPRPAGALAEHAGRYDTVPLSIEIAVPRGPPHAAFVPTPRRSSPSALMPTTSSRRSRFGCRPERWIVTEGSYAGDRGYFTRSATRAVTGLRVAVGHAPRGSVGQSSEPISTRDDKGDDPVGATVG